jgi:hypothetical protein
MKDDQVGPMSFRQGDGMKVSLIGMGRKIRSIKDLLDVNHD